MPFVLCFRSPLQGETVSLQTFSIKIAHFFSRATIVTIGIRNSVIRVHIPRRTIIPIRITTDTAGPDSPPLSQPRSTRLRGLHPNVQLVVWVVDFHLSADFHKGKSGDMLILLAFLATACLWGRLHRLLPLAAALLGCALSCAC